MKIFKEVFNQKVLPDDGHPRAIFDTCRYRIETSWKRNCNWEVTDSKKKRYAFVMAAAEKITLFPNPQTAKFSLSACWRSSTNLTFSAILANLVKDFTTV